MSTTTIRARWYSIDARGMATLCSDEKDALQTAEDNSIQWPNLAPHKAAQLGDVSALWAQHARDSAELRRLCQARDDVERRRRELERRLALCGDALKLCKEHFEREIGDDPTMADSDFGEAYRATLAALGA